MLNSLDLLVIVFMVLVTGGLLSLCLMFLARNVRVKKICFYAVAALGIYAGYIGIRIGGGLFPVQTMIGAVVVVISIAAMIVNLMDRSNEKKFKMTQIVVTAAVVVGIMNAFI